MAVLGEFRRPEAQRDYIGAFLVHYIASTWMNTIIFGIPIVISIYGPAFQVWCRAGLCWMLSAYANSDQRF